MRDWGINAGLFVDWYDKKMNIGILSIKEMASTATDTIEREITNKCKEWWQLREDCFDFGKLTERAKTLVREVRDLEARMDKVAEDHPEEPEGARGCSPGCWVNTKQDIEQLTSERVENLRIVALACKQCQNYGGEKDTDNVIAVICELERTQGFSIVSALLRVSEFEFNVIERCVFHYPIFEYILGIIRSEYIQD